MRNIQPFMVADALADFGREEHMMALTYTAGCSGKVVMTADMMPLPLSNDDLRVLILLLLEDDENLTRLGVRNRTGGALVSGARRYRFSQPSEKFYHRRLVGTAVTGSLRNKPHFRLQR